jgi:hypothetical protein
MILELQQFWSILFYFIPQFIISIVGVGIFSLTGYLRW